jgi:hypothetical protein
MTPTTKDTRRTDWKSLNFAGSIDWAVDLQSFTGDDFNSAPDRPDSGWGCVAGRDSTDNTGDLCEFTCALGYCPKPLCRCVVWDELAPLPGAGNADNIIAWDDEDVESNKLCKFACKYGYCPGELCYVPPPVEYYEDEAGGKVEGSFDYESAKVDNARHCYIYRDSRYSQYSVNSCYQTWCKKQVEEAKAEGRTTNYGCVGFWPLDQPIPWTTVGTGGLEAAMGACQCDNWLVNEIANEVIEALPMIAKVWICELG